MGPALHARSVGVGMTYGVIYIVIRPGPALPRSGNKKPPRRPFARTYVHLRSRPAGVPGVVPACLCHQYVISASIVRVSDGDT